MKKRIGLAEAISIGIGGMVGGGIFAVLGLAVSLAKGGTPIAFLLGGIIALTTSYSYVKLSLTYPDRGGTVKFINQAYGKTVFSGGLNNLLWIGYIIMLSLYASAFGSYAPNLLHLTRSYRTDFHIYASLIILLAAGINYYSIDVVGKIEAYAVVIKLVILVSFVIIGAYGLLGNPNIGQLAPSHWEEPLKLFTAGMVIFVAYEGFELIANAVPDLKDPGRNVPRAYYYSIILVILLYVLIALVTVGSLPFKELVHARDYALAEAARPTLGRAGFIVITIAALISTFSAINASLLGGSRVNYEIGEDDELPHQVTYKLWNQPIGLLVTAALTLIITNILNLETISASGSMSFILVFAMVNLAGFKLANHTGGNRVVPLLGFFFCLLALAVLTFQQYLSNRIGVLVALGMVLAAFVMGFL